MKVRSRYYCRRIAAIYVDGNWARYSEDPPKLNSTAAKWGETRRDTLLICFATIVFSPFLCTSACLLNILGIFSCLVRHILNFVQQAWDGRMSNLKMVAPPLTLIRKIFWECWGGFLASSPNVSAMSEHGAAESSSIHLWNQNDRE